MRRRDRGAATGTVPTAGESLCTMERVGDSKGGLFGFELLHGTGGQELDASNNMKLGEPHTFIISWGEGEDGRFGGGVTINDGWEGVPDFESTLRSCGEGV